MGSPAWEFPRGSADIWKARRLELSGSYPSKAEGFSGMRNITERSAIGVEQELQPPQNCGFVVVSLLCQYVQDIMSRYLIHAILNASVK